MTKDELRAIIIAELGNIAPDADPAHVDPNADLREILDIDSLDFQNLLAAIHKKTGINVPERDYPKLATFNAAMAYLSKSLG